MKRHLKLRSRPKVAQGFAPPTTLIEWLAQVLGLKQF